MRRTSALAHGLHGDLVPPPADDAVRNPPSGTDQLEQQRLAQSEHPAGLVAVLHRIALRMRSTEALRAQCLHHPRASSVARRDCRLPRVLKRGRGAPPARSRPPVLVPSPIQTVTPPARFRRGRPRAAQDDAARHVRTPSQRIGQQRERPSPAGRLRVDGIRRAPLRRQQNNKTIREVLPVSVTSSTLQVVHCSPHSRPFLLEAPFAS